MANTTQFLVEPAEPLVFGPPRSTVAGEAHHIASQFPPSPRTFQGILRTRLLLGASPALDLNGGTSKEEIADLVGPPQALPDGWHLQGPFPAETPEEGGVRPWVPVPRFALKEKGAEDGEAPALAHLIPGKAHPVLTDLGDGDETPNLGRPDLGTAKPVAGWIGPANLRHLLTGGQGRWDKDQYGKDSPPFIKTERQPGLSIHGKEETSHNGEEGTSKHGSLYFAEARRFKQGSGLLGSFSGPLKPPLRVGALGEGTGQAGRKGRLVHFHTVETLDKDWTVVLNGDHLPEEPEKEELFWLVALTPVFLETPNRPTLHGIEGVSILAALTDKPQAIGGLEMATGSPRPNRLYTPAGSAWLIRLDSEEPEQRAKALRRLHNKHPLGDRVEAAMGFGHTLVGLGPKPPVGLGPKMTEHSS